MPLVSKQFKDDEDLQDCLVDDASHVVEGDSGDHVGLIQEALIKLGEGVINARELSEMYYGATTARSVLGYKTRRNIINQRYQKKPDNIVGRMTIRQLDLDMVEFEKKKFSRLVSPSRKGAPHNHSLCPPLEAGDHEATPINPQGYGRKINIYGDGETDYVGFEDYAIDPDYLSRSKAGGIRKLTWIDPAQGGVASGTASDIFMRSSPVYDDDDLKKGRIKPRSTTSEILRMAMPGCRLTYSGNTYNIGSYFPKIERLGVLMETSYVDDQGNLLPFGTNVSRASMIVHVLVILK